MISALALAMLPATPALAAQAKIDRLAGSAWYWEDQQSQAVTDPTSGADVATVEAPNPFCPSTPAGGVPAEGSCRQGRLPVEVRNADYKEPNKISALNFDLSLVPFGSTVSKMTVTLLEAADPQSDPVNAEDKKLMACPIESFFGDGDARLYSEAPAHSCDESSPVAKRKPVTIKNAEGEEEERFAYTFDLTPLAVQWIDEGAPVSAVMLYPVQPKESDFDPSSDSNWRTVLVGGAEEEQPGVRGTVVYQPGETPGLGDLEDPVLDGGGFESPGFSGSSSSDSLGSGTTGGFDAGSDTAVAGDEAGDAAATGDAGEPLAAGPTSDESPVQSLPGYVWLALLAGLMGFAMVRSVVLEKAHGIRPDGVLAQIREINTDRRGVALEDVAAAGSAGRLSSVMEGLKGLSGKASGLFGKLPFKRKG
ncbi:MAG: hypothetical protein ACR2KQ_10395 [Actinomycetota bacterium]